MASIASGKKKIFGKGNPEHLGTIFALEDIRRSLGVPKLLHSHCDPDRKPITAFTGYSAKKNKPIPRAAISYGLSPGSDDQMPETILGMTRNVSGADLKGAVFLGTVMKGLRASEGTFVTSDGAVQIVDNAILGHQAHLHAKATGGNAVGPTSTKIWLPK